MLQSSLIVPCKRCDSPVDLARKASLFPAKSANVLVDIACSSCGQRALYATPRPGPVGQETRD